MNLSQQSDQQQAADPAYHKFQHACFAACIVLGHLIGWLVLGIALWRAQVIPFWAACCFILNVPLTMLAYGRFEGIWQIVGTALIFIGSIPAAFAMLRAKNKSEPAGASKNVRGG